MSSDKYIHSDVENRIYSYWEKNGLFKPKENSKKFSIVIPPPNVTGSLHMGHALNNSIHELNYLMHDPYANFQLHLVEELQLRIFLNFPLV